MKLLRNASFIRGRYDKPAKPAMVRREFFASQIYADFSAIYAISNVGTNAAASIVHRLLILVYNTTPTDGFRVIGSAPLGGLKMFAQRSGLKCTYEAHHLQAQITP
jgi:hypothetical protein